MIGAQTVPHAETTILQGYGLSCCMASVNGASVALGRYQHRVPALGMPSWKA